MSSIQTHHAKLWFAGMNANWRLADFEIHEIMESVDDKKSMQLRGLNQRSWYASPALDTVNNAIVKRLGLIPSKFYRSHKYLQQLPSLS